MFKLTKPVGAAGTLRTLAALLAYPDAGMRAFLPRMGAVQHDERALGAERLATGHYVRRVDGPDGPELHRAADATRDQVVDDVTASMRGQRGLRPSQESSFAIITQDKLMETYDTLFGMFFLVMIVLSAVGLIVGGVGVVAIMMISVTERTREIGVRKALGATRATILFQFLIEAVTLTGIGAVIGLFGGWLVALLIRNSTSIAASVPPLAVVSALLASAVTGVLFGMIPAARASRLDPVEALRHE